MAKQVNVAVIGCGYWGPNLIRNFSQTQNARLYACCDLDNSRLQTIKKQYPSVKITSDCNELFNDSNVDAVVIATPISTHFKIAKEALEHGKHVLIEKPLANSVKEAAELVKIAAQNKKILMVGHTFEYSPPVNKLKEIINSGEIGDIYYLDSFRVNLGLFQPDKSVIWDLAPHDLSIILYLLGKKPKSVSAYGKGYVKGHIEDVAYILIKFDNNIMAHLHVSWLAPCKLRRTTIVGNKKMIVYDDIEPEEKIKVYDKGVSISHEEVSKLPYLYRTGDIYIPKVSGKEPLSIECAHFIECILENKKPRSSGEVGLEVVKILEAAEESIKNSGKEVLIK